MAKTESQQLRKIGEKARSERMVSTYIRAIGNERTEVISTPDRDDPTKESPEIVTKAERLAREIWDAVFNESDKKLKLEYRKLALDRSEGRPAVGSEEQQKRGPIPSKISERGKSKLNQMVEEVGDE